MLWSPGEQSQAQLVRSLGSCCWPRRWSNTGSALSPRDWAAALRSLRSMATGYGPRRLHRHPRPIESTTAAIVPAEAAEGLRCAAGWQPRTPRTRSSPHDPSTPGRCATAVTATTKASGRVPWWHERARRTDAAGMKRGLRRRVLIENDHPFGSRRTAHTSLAPPRVAEPTSLSSIVTAGSTNVGDACSSADGRVATAHWRSPTTGLRSLPLDQARASGRCILWTATARPKPRRGRYMWRVPVNAWPQTGRTGGRLSGRPTLERRRHPRRGRRRAGGGGRRGWPGGPRTRGTGAEQMTLSGTVRCHQRPHDSRSEQWRLHAVVVV